MAIRLRRIDGRLIALCAARSVEKPGDIYLDDGVHGALADKFARDFNAEGWPGRGEQIPSDEESARLVAIEEDNNPNREWWDIEYGDPFNERTPKEG